MGTVTETFGYLNYSTNETNKLITFLSDPRNFVLLKYPTEVLLLLHLDS